MAEDMFDNGSFLRRRKRYKRPITNSNNNLMFRDPHASAMIATFLHQQALIAGHQTSATSASNFYNFLTPPLLNPLSLSRLNSLASQHFECIAATKDTAMNSLPVHPIKPIPLIYNHNNNNDVMSSKKRGFSIESIIGSSQTTPNSSQSKKSKMIRLTSSAFIPLEDNDNDNVSWDQR